MMLAQRFEQQAARTPDRPAVWTGEGFLSYAGLNRSAGGLARAILNALPPADEPRVVALLCGHGVAMIRSILAVLKCGHIYVPLSADYPDARLEYMLRHSGAALLVCDADNTNRGRRLAAGVCTLLVGSDAGEDDVSSRPVAVDHPAYILYTSGSTGRPKGVLQTHENVLYYIRNWTERLGITAADRLTLFSSFSHDGAVQDLFGALLNGACLYPYFVRNRLTVDGLASFIAREGITIWHSVPSLYHYFLNTLDGSERLPSLRFILLGGEPLREHEIRLTRRYFPHVVLGNVYGQTESSVDSIWLVRGDEPFRAVILGQPLSDTSIFLLDAAGEEVGTFATGEILIACRHITPGYWRDPAADTGVFSDDPDCGRLYWTGDLGRRMPDGSIEFLGRRDGQVKIRGFRVEPGEVESVMMRFPGMAECVVGARRDENGEIYLAAHFVARAPVAAADLAEFLARELPDYMVPARYLQLEKLPLLPNNKIDRNSLPEPPLPDREAFVPPRDEWETGVAEIWRGVLGRSAARVGIDENFFTSGGHSLKASELVLKLYRFFGVRIDLPWFFTHATIRAVAERLRREQRQETAAIPALPPQAEYELSSVQRRMFLLQQLTPSGTGYNIPLVVCLRGRLDRERVEAAFRALLQRHEALRTSFAWRGERPVQIVHPLAQPPLQWLDWSGREVTAEHLETFATDFVQPFDLERAPLWRATLVRLGAEEHLLAVDIHHIVGDGTSLAQLVLEFVQLHAGRELPPLRIQYKDFAAWQNRRLADGDLAGAAAFWRARFAAPVPVLELPTDFPRPAVPDFVGRRRMISLAPEHVAALQALARREGATDFLVFFALFGVWLGWLSGQKEVVVGTPVAARIHEDLAGVVGMFVNTLALRQEIDQEGSFREHLRRTIAAVVPAFEYQEYPYESLLEQLTPPRDTGRNPLFDVMFNFQNSQAGVDTAEGAADGLVVSEVDCRRTSSKFDLTFTVLPQKGGFRVDLEYATALFGDETIERWLEIWERLLAQAAADPDGRIAGWPLVGPHDAARILAWNEAAVLAGVPRVGLAAMLEKAAAGDGPALAWSGGVLSHRELHARAGAVAAALAARGVTAGALVAVWSRRTPAWLAAMIAVWRIGAVYLPLDATLPPERAADILRDSGAAIVLADDAAAAAAAAPGGCRVLALEDIDAPAGEGVFPPAAAAAAPEDAAYVIYTSGSTGRPKGVVVEHRQAVYFLYALEALLPLPPAGRVLSLTSPGFDISLLETLWPLATGRTVVLAGEELADDPQGLARWLPGSGADLVQCTPSRLKMLLAVDTDGAFLSGASLLLVGGEAFPPALLAPLQRRFAGRIFNMYGPTETTVWSSARELTAAAEVTIGRPLGNTRLYVCDRFDRLCPPGIPGEICIGGAGVARGYLGRDELTAERFRPDPYAPGGRIYRSGDVGVQLADGELTCRGRLDHQVKVRGHRVELEEIEHHLQAVAGVEAAAVRVWPDAGGDIVLCAYASGENVPAPVVLREELGRRLPEYMVPTLVVRLERLPLTSSGKVDRRALPPPQVEATEAGEGPAGEVEERLATVWSGLLGVERGRIGRDSSFFDLGGHSLSATVLTTRLHQEFGVRVSLLEVFRSPRLRQLAEVVQRAEPQEHTGIPLLPPRDHFELSSAQRRLFLLHQLQPQAVGYNIPYMIQLRGELGMAGVSRALAGLAERHEPLRTCFAWMDGRPVQIVRPAVEIPLEYHDWRTAPRTEAETAAFVASFIRPFDLGRAPLWRAALVRTAAAEFLFLLDMHHIIADAVSVERMVREFTALFDGAELPPVRVQYKDFAAWQNRRLRDGELAAAGEFWRGLFRSGIPELELDTDFPRPAVPDFTGRTVFFPLAGAEAERLREMGRQCEATDFMVLFALFAVWLSRLSGQETVVIGTPAAGRMHADLQGTLGVFTNTLAVPQRVEGELTFRDCLLRVRELLLTAFTHQEYPYEELVESLPVVRNTGRNPLFDAMFVFHHAAAPFTPPATGLQWWPLEYERRGAKFDLTLSVVAGTDGFSCSLEYADSLFRPERVEVWLAVWRELVRQACAPAERPLGEWEMVDAVGMARILAWNEAAVLAGVPRVGLAAMLEKAAAGDGPALAWSGGVLSHRELHARAGAVAAALAARGVTAGALVAVWSRRTPAWLAAMIAVWRIGAVYLPLDAALPPERAADILRDSGAAIVLADDAAAAAAAAPGGCRVLALEDIDAPAGEGVFPPAAAAAAPEDAAYVIYTSGSTGRPKGVVVEHRQAVHFLYALEALLPLPPAGRVLSLTSPGFDISLLETLWPLATGRTVVLADEELADDPQGLARWLPGSGADLVQCTPSRLKMLLAVDANGGFLSGASLLLVGGEAFPPALLAPLQRRFAGRIFNMYGPTETTVWSSARELTAAVEVTIGRPLGNTRLYVCDRFGRLCPPGIPGEICIGGAGVARGYLGRDELTAERFRPDPYVPGGRIYRSGDVGVQLADGELTCRGRLDHQVKVRGHRVELEEIEHHLQAVAGVEAAAVRVWPDAGGDIVLCAYASGENVPAPAVLREELGRRLPEYMVPTLVVRLERLPLTSSGKVDRRALPPPQVEATDAEPPADERERRMAELWSAVLAVPVERIGVHADFFALGGHSLRATTLLMTLNREYHLDLTLQTIFRHPTLRGMAHFLPENLPSAPPPVAAPAAAVQPPAAEPGAYPVSSLQKRLFILQRIADLGTAYNLCQALRIRGPLQSERLQRALDALAARHESLRTSFAMQRGEAVQIVQPTVHIPCEFHGFAPGEPLDEEGARRVVDGFCRPFDLGRAPLVRAALLHLGGEEHILLFDIHHIVSDGTSLGILFRDLLHLYGDAPLPPAGRYRDFSIWEHGPAGQKEIAAHSRYWLERFTPPPPPLALVTDFSRPQEQSFAGDSVALDLDVALTARLRNVGRGRQASLYMVLLAVYNVLLWRYTGQEDIVVGTPAAGRLSPEYSETVGLFINALALRNRPGGGRSFASFLEEVRDNTLLALENQCFPFDALLQHVGGADLSRNPLFQTELLLQNFAMAAPETMPWTVEMYPRRHTVCQVDVALQFHETEDGLRGSLIYAVHLFRRDTMERLAANFREAAAVLAENPDMRLEEFQLPHTLTAAPAQLYRDGVGDFNF